MSCSAIGELVNTAKLIIVEIMLILVPTSSNLWSGCSRLPGEALDITAHEAINNYPSI